MPSTAHPFSRYAARPPRKSYTAWNRAPDTTLEGEDIARFYELPIQFDGIIVFPAVLTIRYTVDERSPLHGMTPANLEKMASRSWLRSFAWTSWLQTHRALPDHRNLAVPRR